MKNPLVLLFSLLIVSCSTETQKESTQLSTQISAEKIPIPSRFNQDSIIKEHLENGAWTKGLFSNEWQEEIDKGLAKDSTIAYLWQQKAMPLYKQGKYELGKKYIDQAVKYNRKEWQEYRAFMSCIFAKRYKEAIADFEDCLRRKGNSYVMDHSYNFYIALSKIQLNQYEEAEKILTKEVAAQAKAQGEDWVHYLDIFYLGIAKYEQRKYEEAIKTFDRALKLYPEFSEVLYYKGNALGRLGNKEAAIELTALAKENGKKGNSIQEDNAIYERYPYQIRWELWN